MLPTYIALPLVSITCFIAAMVPPLLEVARSSLPLAAGFAVLWVALMAAMLYDSDLEGLTVLVAVVTALLSGPAARALAPQLPWSDGLTRAIVVESAMALMATVNLVAVWRARRRRHRK